MPSNQQTIASETRITGAASGCPLYVRRKRLAGQDKAPGERIVVCVHGATYPSSGTFDLPLDGVSWMDDLARAGFDVHALDMAGYGGSGSWAAMQEAAAERAPLLPTADAVADLAGLVDHLLQSHGAARLSLLGWSWGSSVAAAYAARHPAKVANLVLHAPQWIRQTPSMINTSGKLGAFRTVTSADAIERWIGAIPEAQRAATAPQAWQDAWVEANFAPAAGNGGQKTLRAPNGVLKDNAEYWAAGKALYDPAAIEARTLLILGEWDRDTPPYMAQEVFGRLANAAEKRLVILGGGTHMMMLERPRHRLFDETRLFLSQS
ncbi:hypothetical protein GCM10023144_35070 [Pigmentiphaga soli]|uniref:Serine aminopeptidase S33 domain-containing protein n=1 Tax=Pigmentiphaga soli TaxID=1007095 RepID=A0ABP8HEK0_9BURK